MVDRLHAAVFFTQDGIETCVGFTGLFRRKSGGGEGCVQLGLVLPVFPCGLRQVEEALGQPGEGGAGGGNSGTRRAERWQYLTNRLEAASPLAVMSRGYVMAVASSGKLLTSVKQAEVGDRVTLHLQDGKMETNIQEKEVFTHGEEESHL